MTLPLCYEKNVDAPNGKSICVQSAGEHHMGAEHIEFILSQPLLGVKRFFTTNGQAFFHDEDGYFYLYDSCLIVRVHLETWQASYIERPDSLFITNISIANSNMLMKLYGGGKRESQSKPLDEIEWSDGLGYAHEGVFPSAYVPWVEEQESLR